MKNSNILIVLFLLIASCGNASQHKVQNNPEGNAIMYSGNLKTPLKKSDLKSLNIPYNGIFIDGLRWKDSYGNHVVFYTATGLYDSREEDPGDSMSAEIFAYHYTYQDDPNRAKQLWAFQEIELNCPLATLLEFIDGSFHITDLNNDGVVEVWFAYRGGCSGDIAPWAMSVVMYEGNKKYTMNGEVKIILGGGEQAGGESQFDRNFRSAPDVFKKFANELWEKHCFYYDHSKE